jgi:CIC family chloride channel protein
MVATFLKLIALLRTKISRAQFLILLAVVIGLISGLIAVLLKTVVHYLQHWIQSIPISRFSYLLFPAIGLIACVFIIRHFFGGQIERGIAMVPQIHRPQIIIHR